MTEKKRKTRKHKPIEDDAKAYSVLPRKDLYQLVKELPKNPRPYKWYKKTKAELVSILNKNHKNLINVYKRNG